ncbi:hypothetical protein [Algoriphagus mannitolivorans]|uniref:hypothetical protein n=1 Tax=Algoriphagus mannitolivorans TaxID=226504 RepID=UPI0012FC36FB|nr:hypothetical protein [Algoriphagus mannitolivorans]
MNLALFGFFAFQANFILQKTERSRLILLQLIVGWGFLMLGYSAAFGNSLGTSLRFLIILVLIQGAFFINPKTSYIRILIGFLVLQSVFLISLHLILNLFFNMSSYMFLRLFFQAQGWGDVYTFNGLFYNIQILGNALLPFGVFVSLIYYTGIKRVIFTGILFVGMLVAGNFAFLLGVTFFMISLFLVTEKYSTKKFVAGFFVLIMIGILVAQPAMNYLDKTVSAKAQESNPTRIDQAEVLWGNLTENPLNFLLGKGLGNTLKVKTKWRDYTDNIYFELQSLYFLNQMGILNFLIFVGANIGLVFLFLTNTKVKVIYFAYILYAFFNPYFLDTSHIVVIITLVSLNQALEKRESHLLPNEV